MEINNTTLLQDFLNHLNIEDNQDIILSAPFGAGKTHFLREDFTKTYSENYNVIHLFPVNYSVSSNEDIFELIKYDILFELVLNFKDNIQSIDDLELDKGLALQLYITNNFKVFNFFQQLFKISSKVGKVFSEVLDLVKKGKEDFDSFYNELQDNEMDFIMKYVEGIEKTQAVKELDAISVLIQTILMRIGGTEYEKQNVLIIDDLDRIDPEHIFRIFNVLSAHRDYHTSKNKFGFDKVILVCDVKNIKRIYEHRYGKGVDFQGYINKFYSKSIYEFDNKRFIRDSLEKYLQSIQYEVTDSNSPYNLSYNRGFLFYDVFLFLLQMFVEFDLLTIRSIKNVHSLNLPKKRLYDTLRGGDYLNSGDYKFLVFLNYLIEFFGSIDGLKDALLNIQQTVKDGSLTNLGVSKHYQIGYINFLLSNIIEIKTLNKELEEKRYEFAVWDSEIKVNYEVTREMRKNCIHVSNSYINDDHLGINIFKLLIKAIELCEECKYI